MPSSSSTSFRIQQEYRIIGTGLAVPSLITNQNVIDMLPDMGITQKWLEQSVGIKQRHIAIDGMQPSDEEKEYLDKHTENLGGVTVPKKDAPAPPSRKVFESRSDLKAGKDSANSDLCARAIRDAAEHAAALSRGRNNNNNDEEIFNLEDLDMIIVSTVTPDMPCPGTSPFVMEKLGLNNVQVMDIRSACCGSTTALQSAIAYLKTAPAPSAQQIGERIKKMMMMNSDNDDGNDEEYHFTARETSSSSCSGTLDIKTVAVVGCEVGSIFGNLDPKHPAYNRGDNANASMIGDAASCLIVRRFDTLVRVNNKDHDSNDSNNNNNSNSSSSCCYENDAHQTEKFFVNPFGPEILHVEVRCIGKDKEPGMHIPCGGSVHPFSQKVFDQGGHFFHHDFKKVLEYGAELYYNAIQNGLKALGKNHRYQELLHSMNSNNNHSTNKRFIKTFTSIPRSKFVEPSIVDIDLFIPHQANGRITSYAVKMGVEEDKCHEHFSHFGNTANASLPLGIYLEARRDEKTEAAVQAEVKKSKDGKVGIGINKKTPNPPLQENQVVMCLAAESTKWLHGTICLVWHSMKVGDDGNMISSREGTTTNQTSSSSSVSHQQQRNSLSHKWKRFKSDLWFFVLGILLSWMKYIGPILQFVGIGGQKNKSSSHGGGSGGSTNNNNNNKKKKNQ